MPVSGQVAVIGSYATHFGVHHDRGYVDLIREAAQGAIKDAKLTVDDLDAGWVGTAVPEINALEGDSGAALTQAIDFAPKPVTRVSAYCASGMEAVRGGALAIAAGEYDTVIVVGVEKMRDVTPRGSLVARNGNLSHPTLAKGRSGPGLFALLASRYLAEYGRTVDDFARVAVKNHQNAVLNPIAQFSTPVTMEQVAASPLVADPLRSLDCTPTTDGAAALILTSVQRARSGTLPYAVIEGMGFAVTDGMFNGMFNPANDYLGFRATRAAAQTAYRQAGIRHPRSELDLIECHDCFTVTELVNYEDLGLCAPGTGWKLLLDGATQPDGDIPVNVSGGLQSCGHPIGATGVRVVKEIADHVTGRAGARQIANAERGLAHTLGGPGILSSAMVLATGRRATE